MPFTGVDHSTPLEDAEETCSNCQEPIDDCLCVDCLHCSSRVETLCDNCERCTDNCCSCSECSNCGTRNDYVCENCGCCECCRDEGHCTDCCARHNNSFRTEGFLRFHVAQRGEHKINPSRRCIALEVEVSSGDADSLMAYCERWGDALVDDGSLPNEGWELNLNPSSGDKFIQHVEDVAKCLSKANAQASSTSCGMHCHIDARDLCWLDVYKLCKLYRRIEGGLFSIVSRSRRGGRYSGFCSDTYDFPVFKNFKAELISRLYGWKPVRHEKTSGNQKRKLRKELQTAKEVKARAFASYEASQINNGMWGRTDGPQSQPLLEMYYTAEGNVDSIRNKLQGTRPCCTSEKNNKMVFSEKVEKYHSARYHALNLHSLFYRGTVEFRHHQGSVDAKKMQNWGMLCASVVDAAVKLKISEIDALPEDSFDALLSILRPELRDYALSRKEELK